MLEKIFKKFCLALSLLLILTSFSLVFISPTKFSYDSFGFDPFNCKSVVKSVENLELKQTTIVYTKNSSGKWKEYCRLHGDENRVLVGKEKLTDNLKNAFIAIEDERFLTHYGVDWKRTFLAMGNLVFKYYSSNQGGSTITQQLIKNVTDDRDDSSARKIREIARALYLESKMEKDDIMEAYLNTIALGNGICGVQAAANYYFSKDVSKLSLVECASIAAITKHPTKYDPKNNPKDNKTRRNLVISKMYELELITKEEYEEAYDADIKLKISTGSGNKTQINNYFIDAMIEEVIDDLAELHKCSKDIASTMLYNGGYRIYATMKPDIQKAIENVYEDTDEYFNKVSYLSGQRAQSAMTIVDYSGHIMGLVGGVGKKTENRGLNRATQTPQQPGSTMKPLGVYSLAIENKVANYSTVIKDEPIKNYYGNGRSGPRNAGGGSYGNVTVQFALEKSLNTIPVRLINRIGIDKSYKFLTEDLKLNNLVDIDRNPSSLALGGCEHGITTTQSAAAFAIFGNGGKFYEPTTYYSVKDADGKAVLKANSKGKQVISKGTAGVMNRLLQQVVYGAQGTGQGVGYSCGGMRVYGKTGTSSSQNDLWFVGGSPYYVCSMWYGYDKNEELSNNGTTKRVWKAVMSDIHSDLEYKSFEYEDVFSAKYCSVTGKAPGENCKAVTGYYIRGNAVSGECDGVHEEEDETESEASKPSSSASSSSSQVSSSSQTVTSSSDTTTSQTPSTPDSSSSSEVSSSSSESSSSDTSAPTVDGSGSEGNSQVDTLSLP